MIILHKLNGQEFVLNVSQIEIAEAKPDTTITLMNEKMYIVKESLQELINTTIEYYQKIYSENKYTEKAS
jgi:flagellar protein FlbD